MAWAGYGTPTKRVPEGTPTIAPEPGSFDHEVTVRAKYFTNSPVPSGAPAGIFEPGTHVLVGPVERFGDSNHVQVSTSSGVSAWVSKSALRRRGVGAAARGAVSRALESGLNGATEVQQREGRRTLKREDIHWDNSHMPARLGNHGVATQSMKSWKHARPATLASQCIAGRSDEVFNDRDEHEDGIGIYSELFSGPPAEPRVLLKCSHALSKLDACARTFAALAHESMCASHAANAS